MMYGRKAVIAAVLFPLVAALACTDDSQPTSPSGPGPRLERTGAPSPSPLVAISTGGAPMQLWAYTDSDLDGSPSDPINLIFFGNGDAMNVRAALLSLSGNRAGPFASFNCTWTDAIGGDQGAFVAGSGWIGSVIQLECGAYDPFRFHLRLFPANGRTVANAHADVLIPGTEQHQVLTWETAEQFVVYDLSRSGLLAAAPAQTGMINAAPTFREIPPVIYNGLPPALRALTGGPLTGNVTVGVGIPSDGSATMIALQSAPAAGGSSQALNLTFGQIIPKPFCAAGEFVRVDGPVTIRQDVRISPDGTLNRQTFADAALEVRSVDLGTGALGPPELATVRTRYTAVLSTGSHLVLNTTQQQLQTSRAPQQLFTSLRVGSGPARYTATELCR